MNQKKITDAYLKSLKPEAKVGKIPDNEVKGLYLLVNPNGSKYWRLFYSLNGKRSTYAVGVYSTGKTMKLGIAKARDIAREAHQLIAEGIDPVDHRRQQKAKTKETKNSFRNIAHQWIKLRQKNKGWKDSHAKDVWTSLESNVFEHIGDMSIDTITSDKMLEVLTIIDNRGATTILKKVRQRCNGIFLYAKYLKLIKSNPVEYSEHLLTTVPTSKSLTSISIEKLPELVETINTFPMLPTTRAGLLIALYTFLRTNEIRNIRWEFIDFDNATLTIPAQYMKMDREHIVPLSRQALEVFKDLQQHTGHYPFVFASYHKPNKQPMSSGAMISALYKMKYGGLHTVHGFRHLFSSEMYRLEEFSSLIIEHQLSHKDTNKIRGSYNKENYQDQCIEMMQYWAEHVNLPNPEKVEPKKRS